MKRVYLEETSSTNDVIKEYLSGGENVVVCAERQTGGRGTKGRTFSSEKGGVYLSALTFYKDLPAERAFEVMAHAATAVCKTLSSFGISPEIKWSNDVLAGGRKISGILTENLLAGGYVTASVVGVGLNVSNPLKGLENIAVSMEELLPSLPTVEKVREKLIKELFSPTDFSDYLRFVKFLGKPVLVTEGERQYTAVAREILPDGRLSVEENGKLRALSAAEIAIKW